MTPCKAIILNPSRSYSRPESYPVKRFHYSHPQLEFQLLCMLAVNLKLKAFENENDNKIYFFRNFAFWWQRSSADHRFLAIAGQNIWRQNPIRTQIGWSDRAESSLPQLHRPQRLQHSGFRCDGFNYTKVLSRI